eukprot:30392-Pelagococcus_subviridis.AAC.1
MAKVYASSARARCPRSEPCSSPNDRACASGRRRGRGVRLRQSKRWTISSRVPSRAPSLSSRARRPFWHGRRPRARSSQRDARGEPIGARSLYSREPPRSTAPRERDDVRDVVRDVVRGWRVADVGGGVGESVSGPQRTRASSPEDVREAGSGHARADQARERGVRAAHGRAGDDDESDASDDLLVPGGPAAVHHGLPRARAHGGRERGD